MIINGYTLDGELDNKNSGYSKWGFATKGSKKYFIKELINPVYPTNTGAMSTELYKERVRYCEEFENRFKSYYAVINDASSGKLVRIEEFFRCGTRYYVVTEKVENDSLSAEELAALSESNKLLLFKCIANGFKSLHNANIVHFDVKPANILVKRTRNGKYTAKLIDFDAGYFKGEDRSDKELGGDLTYLAPETFLAISGMEENVYPDEKSDIFALGLIFHEFYCGHLPYYDENEYDYPYESALDGAGFRLEKSVIPEKICNLIESMLSAEAASRPSANEIVSVLNSVHAEAVTPPIKSVSSEKTSKKDGNWFTAGGDL